MSNMGDLVSPNFGPRMEILSDDVEVYLCLGSCRVAVIPLYRFAD